MLKFASDTSMLAFRAASYLRLLNGRLRYCLVKMVNDWDK